MTFYALIYYSSYEYCKSSHQARSVFVNLIL